MGGNMNRAGFFKTIIGGVAAMFGLKPIVQVNAAVNSGKTGMVLADIQKAYEIMNRPKPMQITRLQKAMQEESDRMQEHVVEILEERHKARMEMLGLDNENKT